jgi:hypothetical protein
MTKANTERIPVTAEIDGFGGRYAASFRAKQVWDNGRMVPPLEDGAYLLYHPDRPDIGEYLTWPDIHALAWGRAVAGRMTIKRDSAIYNSKGERVEPTTRPVGWSGHPQSAVRIGNELVLVSDLWKSTWGGGALIDSGRVPGYSETEENY